ncbi:nicotinamide riboside transporter PnuC [Leptospira bandrabouensis]|uniref:nicotinamide riboside transporter PnuC n=1 Tax=Leptospira bandrabouensis TaxID=2484903 RepID=UPI00223E63B5|nr:nicotinamide riboside transporter PnuC [Leptospira bandrabouensis]MCW7458109.1 nicotinamide riboside transporter PnuC [Leptospira bandrabouensis]MCW7478982.1 nicotinamide riboside transporter PnuC [Leptospira bandrabouensis]MCW7486890.1 nicotinamide riboside transporter PnuC [Leptospira bandrabouensis]
MFDLSLIFSKELQIFSVFGNPISLIELLGTSTGLLCVYLASRNHILTWPFGILTSICFFFLFFQIQLYSDMLLQIYFFGSSVYGWIVWRKKTGVYVKIQSLSKTNQLIVLLVIFFGTYILGAITSRLPIWLPNIFTKPPEFLYWDAFTTVGSIVANFLLAQRKLESWFIWVFVDVVCITIYSLKEIPFVTLEYIVFLLIAFYGCHHWYQEYKLNHHSFE